MAKVCARLVCAAALLLFFVTPGSTQPSSRDRIQGVVDASNIAAVPGTAHPLAGSGLDQGRTNPSKVLSAVTVVFRLSPAQQADLNRLLREQQDPSSANFHKWLTPDQYASRFGLTDNDLAKVTNWVKAQGLQLGEISRNRTEITFSGTVSQIEHALQTEIHDYSVNGQRHFANATDVSFPAAFSAHVLAIRGLNDFHPKPHIHRVQPQFTSNLSGNHFLEPGDFATIYNLGPLYSQGLDGSGQKIVVVGQTIISPTDIAAFRSASGLSANSPTLLLVPNEGPGMTCSGDVTEADLDVEWSGGVAKGASVLYVYAGVGSGGSCTNRIFDVFNALHYAITQNLGPVISISYGNCEANIGSTNAKTFRQWVQQANSQGQTVVAAAGDDGAADCDFNVASATHGLAVDIPASIPEVTGIGGTEFTGDAQATVASGCAAATAFWSGSCSTTSGASALSYIPEMVWNDTTASIAANQGFAAGGGGASTFFTKVQAPWQTGPGVPSDGKRDVPDISLNASNFHDPYLICSQSKCVNGFRDGSNNLTAVGGTSVGAPSFAGILAIINQATSSVGQANANTILYNLAVSTPSAFHDTTTGNNKVPCTTGTTNCASGGTIGFSAGANYDQASGLGSIDAFTLVTSWTGFSSSPGFSVVANPATLTIAAVGQSGNSTVTVSGSNGFTGTIQLTCAVPSTATTNISCSVAPTSVALTSTTTSGTATLTINALASSGAMQHGRSEWLMAAFVLPGLVFFGFPMRRRGQKLLAIFVLAVVGLAPACGGGETSIPNQHTQSATYSITVNGASGTVSHGTTVSVTVK